MDPITWQIHLFFLMRTQIFIIFFFSFNSEAMRERVNVYFRIFLFEILLVLPLLILPLLKALYFHVLHMSGKDFNMIQTK